MESMESIEAIRKHTRVYVAVFAALAFLTLVTVAISYLHLAFLPAMILALVIASIKGFLVAAYFMHLITEKKAIILILALTAVFFLMLLILPSIP